MKKLVYVLLIGILSCDKNDNENILPGVYTETEPHTGRSQLEFVTANRVIKTERGSPTEDVFYYQITGNKIKLTPTWDSSSTTQFELHIQSSSQFIIENLYVSIPESPKTYMTYKK
jgi:hypothetical protein